MYLAVLFGKVYQSRYLSWYTYLRYFPALLYL